MFETLLNNNLEAALQVFTYAGVFLTIFIGIFIAFVAQSHNL